MHRSRLIAFLLGPVLPVLAQDPTATPPSAVTTPPAIPAPAPASAPAAAFAPVILEPEIRAVTRLHNSMSQPLVGIGIITGLAGTGASDRSSRQALLNLVRREGLNITIADVIAGGTALVSVTATLPPFAKVGQPIDVKAEVLGDATSLRGGQLMRCELRAVDGTVYVIAQGALLVNGFAATGQNASVQRNHPTTGWVTNGGQVVKDLESSFFSASGHLELQVLNPSTHNAQAIANGIRTALDGTVDTVYPVDPTLVRIELEPDERTPQNAMRLLGLLSGVRVRVENPARIMVDQATGTVLAGQGVMISPCVVAVSDLTIAVVNEEEVSQPIAPFSQGTSERVGRTRIDVTGSSSDPKPFSAGASVGDLLQNLRSLGLTPSQLVAVFQALEMGGYLHAELEIR